VSLLSNLKQNWLQPFFYLGRNRLSLLGGALTSASAFVLIGFWVVDTFGHGGSTNPYIGIIVFFFLPALFLLGLVLMPIGIYFQRRSLIAAGQLPSIYPKIDIGDPLFRHALDFVIMATFINFVIVGVASYRGVAYMDQPNFCGVTCHVMAPEWTAYHVAPHSSVACTECHVAPGVPGYIHAKVNGTKQLIEVVLHTYPTPIMPGDKIPLASVTCLNCHNAKANIGDKLVVKTTYGDDEHNSMTQSLLMMHVGGSNEMGALSGIHGAHTAHIEFISTDSTHQTIPWVAKTNSDGTVTEYVADGATIPAKATKHVMDCMDCHNRPAHSMQTAEQAIDKAITQGGVSTALPFVHGQGLQLIQADYKSQDEATRKITSGLIDFYRTTYPDVYTANRAEVVQAAQALASAYKQNVFPDMKVIWGTHPNNIGHADYPGCFRCHDSSHNAKNGTSITQDCTVCHNIISTDDPSNKLLSELGMDK